MHQLVAWAFLGPEPRSDEPVVIRHLDGDPSNNRALNLAYGSNWRNTDDRFAGPGIVGVPIGPSLLARLKRESRTFPECEALAQVVADAEERVGRREYD
ncbi:MAG: hypothetical protein ACI80V_000162 [Rhodothermales bacterium]|jgi:hypothetical protein